MRGADEQNFDVALLTLLEETPAAFLGERPDADFFSENNARLRQIAQSLGIRQFVKAFLTIQPRRKRAPATVRHRAMGWETMMRMTA